MILMTESKRYQRCMEGEQAPEQSVDSLGAKWLQLSSVLWGHTETYAHFALNISKLNSKAQILDIICQVTLGFHLRLDWRFLPHDWLAAAEKAFFSTTSHFSLYIPLHEEVLLASSDGDGISEFHLEPLNVTS